MKPGDKVVCIDKVTQWHDGSPCKHNMNDPKYGKIYIINGKYLYDGIVYLSLVGFNDDYEASGFVPLDHWKQAEYMVEELKEELEVTV